MLRSIEKIRNHKIPHSKLLEVVEYVKEIQNESNDFPEFELYDEIYVFVGWFGGEVTLGTRYPNLLYCETVAIDHYEDGQLYFDESPLPSDEGVRPYFVTEDFFHDPENGCIFEGGDNSTENQDVVIVLTLDQIAKKFGTTKENIQIKL